MLVNFLSSGCGHIIESANIRYLTNQTFFVRACIVPLVTLKSVKKIFAGLRNCRHFLITVAMDWNHIYQFSFGKKICQDIFLITFPCSFFTKLTKWFYTLSR